MIHHRLDVVDDSDVRQHRDGPRVHTLTFDPREAPDADFFFTLSFPRSFGSSLPIDWR
jgi:hypothetical protein